MRSAETARKRFGLLVLLAALVIIVSSLLVYHPKANAALKSQLTSFRSDFYSNPYGFTDVQGRFTDQAVADMHDLGLSWVRSQLDWSDIETAPGVYDWSTLDSTVSRANAGHVNLVFPIRNAPDFHLTQTCTTADGKFSKQFPGAADMAQFATALATRYDGRHGHGRIQALQIGNEEWDDAKFGTIPESEQCRQPSFYAPVLAAAYDAIKRVDRHMLVVGTGLFWKDPQHQHDWYAYLYQHGDADKFDVAAFHYYLCTYDPNVGNDPDWPRFNEIVDAIAQADIENYVFKPIWVTETGWTISAVNQNPNCVVSQEQVAHYMEEELDDARNSLLVTKIFWFTMDEGNNGMSITQNGVKTQAYNKLKDYIQNYPQWWEDDLDGVPNSISQWATDRYRLGSLDNAGERWYDKKRETFL
ncbi:glycosyl hydrolase [Ktedonosporobacter rubrisoli]|nr:glycosyl hydrolase [Ktedonosporobacter rubrisoli]